MMTTQSNDAIQQVDRVADLLLQLLETRSLSDAARVLRDNPELLSSVTLALLTALKKQVGGVDEEEVAAQITFFERLIRRSSEVGLDAAIEEAASGVPASPALAILGEAAAFPTVPEDLKRLDDLIARLIASADDLRNEPPETRAALLSEAARLSLRREKGEDTTRNNAIGLFRAAAHDTGILAEGEQCVDFPAPSMAHLASPLPVASGSAGRAGKRRGMQGPAGRDRRRSPGRLRGNCRFVRPCPQPPTP